MEILLKQPYSFYQKGKRSYQEDARYPDEDVPQGCKPAFIVCDGVGGQDNGEVASRTVADAMGSYMQNVNLSKPFTTEDFGKVLEYSYSCLYKRMRMYSKDMATTMTFVCFNKDGVFCAHMGDSRIYHVRPGVGILYQSEDHSLVNALVHSGNLTPEEAINHPKSNVITRCISYVEKGVDKPSATTIQINDVEKGDYFFLCTDGVLHCVDDDELLSILSSDISDKEKIDIIAKKSKNSYDNNTAFLVGIENVITEGKEFFQQEDLTQIDNFADEKSGTTTMSLSRPYGQSAETFPSEESTGKKLSNFIRGLFRY